MQSTTAGRGIFDHLLESNRRTDDECVADVSNSAAIQGAVRIPNSVSNRIHWGQKIVLTFCKSTGKCEAVAAALDHEHLSGENLDKTSFERLLQSTLEPQRRGTTIARIAHLKV